MRTVVQYKSDSYLPVTENWIHGQIEHLERYRPVVYCREVENGDVFRAPRARSLGWGEIPAGVRAWLFLACHKRWGFFPDQALFMLVDRPSLVHAHFGFSAYAALPLARMFRTPLVASFYGYDLSGILCREPLWRERYGELFRHGRRFLVEGNAMLETLVSLGCPREKAAVHHLGVDLEKIAFAPREVRGGGGIRVLVASSFREKKGIPTAIEAFARVKREHPGARMSLTVIGDSGGRPREEEEKRRIMRAVREADLGESLTMLGYQPLAGFYHELHRHHIFLAASMTAADGDSEGGAPVSIIEASASGMPVVSTTHCDIPEVVVDGESGYLAPEGDAGALAEALERLLLDPGLLPALGMRGRRHIEENYDARRQARSLEDIYDTVVGEGR